MKRLLLSVMRPSVMRPSVILASVLLGGWGCADKAGAPPTSPKSAASAAPKSAASAAAKSAASAAPKRVAAPKPAIRKAPASATAAEIKPGDTARLPPADRVFHAGGRLLGASKNQLWAARAKPDGGWTVDWVTTGPGVAHRLTYTRHMQGEAYVVAWGVGRGFLKAPLVLMQHDPATGQGTELWRDAGPRNESAHLSTVMLDGDTFPDIAFAYYASKYMVRTRHLLGGEKTVKEGKDVRMASSRAYGDLDGDKKTDEVVGRVYGDAKGEPGDLTVHFGNGKSLKIPTDRGVKAVFVGKVGADKTPALYFADGWEANYGKKAKAQVKRVAFDTAQRHAAPARIAQSADEFTFFDLSAADLDGDGQPELIARGNKKLTAFKQGTGGAWTPRILAGMQPVLNTAVGKTARGWMAFIPTNPRTPGVPVRAVPLAQPKR